MSEDLLTRSADGVLTVTWNAPDRLNSLTAPMLDAATDAIETVGEDIRCIVITGEGRAFGAGAALGEDDGRGDTLAAINRLVTAITTSHVPVIAGVNGLAAGASVSLALAADLVIARRSSYFLLAFVNIALMPDGGATELVAASVGRAKAMSMAMLGERLPAEEAAERGLISAVVDDEAFDEELAAVAAKLAHGPTVALGLMKAAINSSTIGSLDAALERETEGQFSLFDTADSVEGVAAFREKRTAVFDGR